MDIGTGIAYGMGSASTILGIVAVIFRIFPRKNNPGNPGNPGNSAVEKRLNAMDDKFKAVRYGDTCDEIVKRIEGMFGMLKETVDKGFKNMNTQFGEIRKKLK